MGSKKSRENSKKYKVLLVMYSANEVFVTVSNSREMLGIVYSYISYIKKTILIERKAGFKDFKV